MDGSGLVHVLICMIRRLLLLFVLSPEVLLASSFPVADARFEAMLRPAESGGFRYSRATHEIIPLHDGGFFVLWSEKVQSIYINGSATFITRIDARGEPASPTTTLAAGTPRVVMNERVALVAVGEVSCARFAGCSNFASLFVIDRRSGEISRKFLGSHPRGSQWTNDYRVTWNGTEFVILGQEGRYYQLYGTAVHYVARFDRNGEAITIREREEWPTAIDVLPARSGYATVTRSIPAEWALHDDSGTTLAKTTYPGQIIDSVMTEEASFVLVNAGAEDQLWLVDLESRPTSRIAAWSHDEYRAIDLATDSSALLVVLRRADTTTHASAVISSVVTAPVAVPSTTVNRTNHGFAAATIRRDIAGDAGQLYVRTATTLDALDDASSRLASLRAISQTPIAIAADRDVVWAVWSEGGRALLQRVMADGTRLDGDGRGLPVSPTDIAISGGSVLAAGQAAAVWLTSDLSEERVIALPEPDRPKKITASRDGYLVYWTSVRGGIRQIAAARISATGHLLDPAGFLVMPTGVDQHDPVIEWTGERYLLLLAQRFSDVQELLLSVTLSPSGTATGEPRTISSHLGVAYQSLAFAFRDGVGLVAFRSGAIAPYSGVVAGERLAWVGANGELLHGTAEDVGIALADYVCCSSGPMSVVATPTRFLVGIGSTPREIETWFSVARTPNGGAVRLPFRARVSDAAATATGAWFLVTRTHDDFQYGITSRTYVTYLSDRKRPARRM